MHSAGFTHSAFAFANESLVTRIAIDPNAVPPGSLVTFIQRGMQYLEIEANLEVTFGLPAPAAESPGPLPDLR